MAKAEQDDTWTIGAKIGDIFVKIAALHLRANRTHTMFCVVSSLLCVLHFHHEGKLVTVDQLSLFSSSSSNNNIPYMENTEIPCEIVGAGLFKDSTLMGTFTLPPPNVHSVNMILDSTDPWIIPTIDQLYSFGNTMTLSPFEINYQEIVLASMVT